MTLGSHCPMCGDDCSWAMGDACEGKWKQAKAKIAALEAQAAQLAERWYKAEDLPACYLGWPAWEWSPGMEEPTLTRTPRGQYSREPRHCAGLHWMPIWQPAAPKVAMGWAVLS